MKRSLGVLFATLTLLGACTATSTSTDDTVSTASTDEVGDPSLGGLTRVTGSVTTAELTGVVDGPVPMPVVLTVSSSGGGNGAVITGIDTAGGDTVVWDGGRPITLSGDGTISIQPGLFRVVDGALVADLSDAAHALSPGSYAVSGPVAVGDGRGLAIPSTQTAFTAGDGAVLSGTGAVDGRLPAGTWTVIGPGRLTVTGDLLVETADATRRGPTASMDDGSYEATFTVSPDGTVSVEALLEADAAV